MKKEKGKFCRDLIVSLVKFYQHLIDKYFKKEKSEFGKGLVVCLAKFYQHFSPEYLERINICKGAFSSYYGNEEKALSRGITLWANGASDHLYEIEAPEGKEWNEVKEKVKILQDSGLEMGHGIACYTKDIIYALKDVERLRELAEEILMAVNNKLKLNFHFEESQELDIKMLMKIDKKLGLKPDWGEW
ncbi:hypothetical protein ES695_13640 [Candidatus Atribacteria bacterium 1244-E10-H5-B2]|nr:MAG: hypothetical protein ES695_13640 [Candidatus Atribacteria bacterium 1244-E10-H5-B2]